jgi:K+-sensing histidine kinase KdpD
MSKSNDQPETTALRLLSNFVHQVINPLNGVIGTLDNLIDGTVPPERREQRLKAVRAQLEWSVLLVRNLAYFANTSLTPGAPQGTNIGEPCVIPRLVIEAVQFFQEPGLSRGIKIHLEDRMTQYTVEGSPDLLRQVFMNIFDNAVKYSDPDTEVRIVPRVQRKTGALLIEISSVGPGFRFEEAERLFEVGYRGGDAKNRIAAGTGLGLYICRRIMEDVFKGAINAEHSNATRTTTFRLRFPDWRK